ncbi:MAG: PIN domain-containing protein [Verrucomicrobiota bacterium]
MIGVDTSSLVAFLQGDEAKDVELVAQAVDDELLIIPPFVIAELFSARGITDGAKQAILELPQLPIEAGFWERVGKARLKLLQKSYKARTLDTMIAVYCIDHGIPLIARDSDYRHFVKHFKLKLLG